MKIKFHAIAKHYDYTITATSINGFDMSGIPADTRVSPLPLELADTGIRAIETDASGEVFVTLQQSKLPYEYPVNRHDWSESDWIDATSYDPSQCYIVPTAMEGKTDYRIEFRDTTETLPNGQQVQCKGWTVVKVQPEEAEA